MCAIDLGFSKEHHHVRKDEEGQYRAVAGAAEQVRYRAPRYGTAGNLVAWQVRYPDPKRPGKKVQRQFKPDMEHGVDWLQCVRQSDEGRMT